MSGEVMPDAPFTLPSLGNQAWRERNGHYLMSNYGERRIALVRGEGTRVWDADGKSYLDFLTGISVNNLGHCHPRITEAIRRQAGELVHCSNLYYMPVQIELARMLIEHSFADRIIFGNSGAEANEAAIKIARRYMSEVRGEERFEIVAMKQSFHGRTMATLTATGQEKVKIGFAPLLTGFVHAEFNNLDSVSAAISPRTAAIMLEPIQGESGILPAGEDFVRGIRSLCDEHGLLMMVDEVQSGLGRAGALFAHEAYGVAPDVMTIAKSLGGGLAMGAMLCTEAVSEAFPAGSHGSTMAGNPLTSAAALAYVSELIEGDWPRRGAGSGEYFAGLLRDIFGASPLFKELRVRGLMIGLQLTGCGPQMLAECEKRGLLLNCTAGDTLRFLPPLNVTRDEMDEAAAILRESLAACDGAKDAPGS